MNKNIIIGLILIIVAATGGFYAGKQYQNSNPTTMMQQGNYRQRFGNNQSGFRPIRGSVLSNDATGLTVKLTDGSSKIIVVSKSTMFIKTDTGAQTDIKPGDNVMVFGTQNSDGSVTAQNVQINPPQPRGMMGGQGSQEGK